MRPEQRKFLDLLAETGSVEQSIERVPQSRNTVYSWRFRDSTFRVAWDLALGRYAAPQIAEGQVPDFLTWRERHCAYVVNKPGEEQRVQRAQNYWFQYEAVKALENHDRLIMVLPPGHLKTSLFGIEYPTWRIMRDRNFRALMIRANESVAQDNTAAIGVRLSDHDYYADMSRRLVEQGEEPLSNPITRYGGKQGWQPQGRKIGERWAGGEFTVAGRTSGEKDATVKAIGMDGSIPGYRADLIVIDDPQDPTKFDASGVFYSEKLMKKFERDILGRLLPGGKIVILANRLGPNDFIGMLTARYEDNPNWHTIYWPAIIERHGREEPLCPEVFSMGDLEQRRLDVGEDAWAFHYMQLDTDQATATFPRDTLDSCKNWDRIIGERTKSTDVVLGIDPALKEFCAMVVLGVDRAAGKRYLLDYHNEKGMARIENVVAKAVQLVNDYGIRTCVVETNNTQQTFFQAVKEAVAPYGCRTVEYKTVTSTGAQAEQNDFDISSIADLMANRLVDLPYGDKQTRDKIDHLCQQFQVWHPRPPGRTSWHLTRDIVMAWLFAESEARKFVKRASRPVRKRRPDVPDWATNDDGGYAWAPQGRPSEDEKVRKLERLYGV